MSVDVKQAAIQAHQYLKSLQEVFNDRIENLALEEVELSEDRKFWLITLGFDRLQRAALVIPAIGNYVREYKIFKINTDTGEVESMKIREI